MKVRIASLRGERLATAALAGLVGVLVGASLARGPAVATAAEGEGEEPHRAEPAVGVKAPVAEVMHCPLAFEGLHLQQDRPTNGQVAYHYCKPREDGVVQCLLYDGTGPEARLIGVEYLVSAEVYQKMPRAEQAFWHDHEYEVDAGLLRSLTQHGAEEKQALAKVRTLYGKVFHTWLEGQAYPEGPPRLFWSVTGKAPFVAPPGVKARPTNEGAGATDRH